jgi:uncharacterized protein involved in propanediol utilization
MPVASVAPSRARPRVSEGQANGTFGELLQGVLLDGTRQRHFLATLPITHGSTARFAVDADLGDVQVLPAHKVKSRQLARNLLESFDLPPGGRLELRGQLPEGKGLASSSADLVATARAIATHFSLALSADQLQALMRRIEPSDGVMYDGITAFFHREVRLLEGLGHVPPLTIVAVDEGGQIDTLAFNTRSFQTTATDLEMYAQLLEKLRRAVAGADLVTLGRVATRSAVLNQPRLAKRWLQDAIQVCDDVGGLGVAVAHSGTCLGILLDTEGTRFREQFAAARTRLQALTGHVLVYQTRSCC